MKKALLTLAVAMIAISAVAQPKFYAGGSLGYTSSSYDGETVISSLAFLPEVGWAFNQNMAVGMEFGYSADSEYPMKDAKETLGQFVLAPYFRYTFLRFGDVALFGDAKLSYALVNYHTNYSGTTSNDKANSFGIHIQPGIAYSLNEHISLVAKLGDVLGFESSKEKASGAESYNTFSLLNLSNALSFGCYYNF